MRDILFRGKRVDNGEWFEGFYAHSGEKKYIIVDNDIAVSYVTMKEIVSDTIGEFTGLADNNGKKIFEGDIGRYKQTDGAKENGKPIICTGKVIYNAKTASYAVENKDEKGRKYFDYFPIKDFEIIGNIHDNSELLKGGAE